MVFLIHVCIECNKGFLCHSFGPMYTCFCLSEHLHFQNEIPAIMFFCSGVCYRYFTKKLIFNETYDKSHVFKKMNTFHKQRLDCEEKKLEMIEPFVFKKKDLKS